jgi:hypothetical protein
MAFMQVIILMLSAVLLITVESCSKKIIKNIDEVRCKAENWDFLKKIFKKKPEAVLKVEATRERPYYSDGLKGVKRRFINFSGQKDWRGMYYVKQLDQPNGLGPKDLAFKPVSTDSRRPATTDRANLKNELKKKLDELTISYNKETKTIHFHIVIKEADKCPSAPASSPSAGAPEDVSLSDESETEPASPKKQHWACKVCLYPSNKLTSSKCEVENCQRLKGAEPGSVDSGKDRRRLTGQYTNRLIRETKRASQSS